MLALVGLWRVRLNRRMAMGAANRLRRRHFHQLLHLPYSFFLEHHAGGQANSYLNDIDDIDQAVTGFAAAGLRNVAMVAISGGLLIAWNPLLGITT